MGRKSTIKSRNSNPKKIESLVEQLTETFKKHGTRKYTMETISAELGISKATLYQYFSSKDEMVNKVLMNLLSDVAYFENNLNDTTLSFEDRYYKNLDLFSNAFSGMSNVFIEDIKIDYPIIWQEVEKFNDYVAAVIQKFYEKGIEAGVFTTIEVAILVKTDSMFLDMIADTEFLEKSNLTAKQVFEEFFKMKLYGILKNKPSVN